MNTPSTPSLYSCADEYDPHSMTVEQARSVIARYLKPVAGTMRVPVRSALNRVLAEDVLSPLDVPAHANSAMDGYAVRFSDLAASGETGLAVAQTLLAGAAAQHPLVPDQAARIMTGAMLPAGADTVVMQEQARREGERVWVAAGQRRGQHVRLPGEDLSKGLPALHKGRKIRPAELGLLASLGIGEILVYRPLRVAFFSTGDELVSIGHPLEPGQIYDSNRYTLYGMLTELGFDCLDMGVVRDHPVALENAFEEASRMADVVITSGGVSVGEADFIKPLLARLGETVFWKIAMKPGRPLAYGHLGESHFFGLPGNPVAVMVTFYTFVRDALLALSGISPVAPAPRLRVRTTTPLKKAPGRTEFQRGIVSRGADGTWTVRSTGNQGSGILRSMSEANCFIILPLDSGPVPAGEEVEIQLFEGIL
ncbi:MAG: molybdopterin molybdotransferase MoeA [Betaproteobacteria bacterium]|nr:molybdopterin molybdotransferase MoeA [Betaproteobacteria bacterium]MDE2622802.1 molybdopterin molybdotransferase MoeA [Betaproteobacteria bacterium]